MCVNINTTKTTTTCTYIMACVKKETAHKTNRQQQQQQQREQGEHMKASLQLEMLNENCINNSNDFALPVVAVVAAVNAKQQQNKTHMGEGGSVSVREWENSEKQKLINTTND